MSLTLTAPSPDYTIGIHGTLGLDLISTQAETYIFELSELPGGIPDFQFEIDKDDAEKEGNINPGKVFIWAMDKLKELICNNCK